ncbi:MAG: DUF362 domain-containing protein [Deltaproteobacteria bacterium]|nr:DUF362 domain-containing protein [Deltaproteobacteria bacterium]
MSDKGRREFFKDVAKYCGAGVAALGLLNLHKTREAHAIDDLDYPSTSNLYKNRDAVLDAAGEFIKNANLPEGWFTKEPEEFINDMKPVVWSHYHKNWYTAGNKSLVGMIQSLPQSKDLKGDIKRAVDKIGGLGKSLKKSDRIWIKPNWNSGDPWPGCGTDVRFLKALVEVLQDEGYGKLTVGESCGPWGPTKRVAKILGMDTMLKEAGVPVIYFDEAKWMHITNKNAEYLGRWGGGDGTVAYPESMRNFDKIIYTPLMKTHLLGQITMSLKLSVGILHRADRNKHLHAFNHLFCAQQAAEINLPLKPDLIIMDGRRVLVSGGPMWGEEVSPGVILSSGDQVAMDVIGTQMIKEWTHEVPNRLGGDPWKHHTIAQAVKVGAGYAKGPGDLKLLVM